MLPTEVTTPAARVGPPAVGIAVLTTAGHTGFAGWGPTRRRRPLASGCSGCGSSPTAASGWAWSRSLLRTVLKFTVPWELAHTAVWNLLAWPGDGGSVVDMVLLGVANAVIVVDLVSLFVGTRRTPYDRIAGTLVVTTG